MHIFIMLFLLSILVLVHELGHFWVARKCGVKVEKFGFGLPFGPTLYETKWGETTICIHAFLLGGYVSFPDDDPDSDLAKEDPRRISNKPVWQRMLIVSAGVIANMLIAYILVIIVAAGTGGVPSGKYDTFVKGIQNDKNLYASQLNIKEGDKIVSANGVTIDSPLKFIEIAQRSKKFDGYAEYNNIKAQKKSLIALNPSLAKYASEDTKPVEKGLKIIIPELIPEKAISLPKDTIIGFTTYEPEGYKLSGVQEKLRNSLEGKKELIADGKVTIKDLTSALSDTVHPVNIVVNRNGKTVNLAPAYPNKKGLIGISMQSKEVNIATTNPITVITKSWDYLYRSTHLMVYGLWKIVTGHIPLNNLNGIVAIVKVGGDIIDKNGIWDGLLLTALISMNLAIVNLLPIPALDGGHLMFLLIEKITGKPVNEEFIERVSKYGFLFLICLMILIVFNDIVALVTNKL